MADESEYSEESYYEEVTEYEEEYVEEDPVEVPAAPASRPVHPLFAGGGAKNALAAAANNMNKTRSSDPISSAGPMSGNSGAAKRTSPTRAAPPPKKSNPLAEQVAAMAARRAARANGGNVVEEVEEETYEEESKPELYRPKPTSTAPKKPIKVIQNGKGVEKKGSWFAKKEKPAANPAPSGPTKKIVYNVPAAKPKTTVVTPKDSAPAFTKVKLQGVNRSNAPAATSSSSSPASINAAPVTPADQISQNPQARLKRNGGIDAWEPSKQKQLETPEQAVPFGPAAPELVNIPFEETNMETRKVTKKVIKHDPEFETVEYKVGCFCTVL